MPCQGGRTQQQLLLADRSPTLLPTRRWCHPPLVSHTLVSRTTPKPLSLPASWPRRSPHSLGWLLRLLLLLLLMLLLLLLLVLLLLLLLVLLLLPLLVPWLRRLWASWNRP